MIDLTEITVFAPIRPVALHNEVLELFCRKTGAKVYNGHNQSNGWLYMYEGEVMGNACKTNRLIEVSVRELYDMPDYCDIKEMTLPEIIKELGYEVKIVK